MVETTLYRFGPSPHVRASISDDGLILLDIHGGVLLSSNIVGARIWQLVEQQRTAAEIVSRLALDYDVAPARAEHDVITFLAALAERGLVRAERRC